MQHELGNRQHNRTKLDRLNEAACGQPPALGMLPAQQGLDAYRLECLEVDDRLIVEIKVTLGESIPHGLRYLPADAVHRRHVAGEALPAAAPDLLGRVQ